MDVQRAADEWTDDDWVTLSALQHYSYCPRQYALIYKEQIFDENYFTMRGRLAHERADEPGETLEGDSTVFRALTVWSDRFGLLGKCDVVELCDGVPYPVEYKHGRIHASIHDEVQLCAQAICLEEMFHTPILTGAVYHISSRHRREVHFTPALRELVLTIVEKIRTQRSIEELPAAFNDARCPDCSLIHVCMPEVNAEKTQEPYWHDRLPEEVFQE